MLQRQVFQVTACEIELTYVVSQVHHTSSTINRDAKTARAISVLSSSAELGFGSGEGAPSERDRKTRMGLERLATKKN